MQMVMFMRASGKMTKHTVKAHTGILMGLSIKVSGRKISSMERAQRHGLMVLVIKETTLKAKRTESASLSGQMDPRMMVILLITTSMAAEYISGLTTENTRASGRTTRCTERVFSLGLTVVSTTETTTMTRKRAREYSRGQTAGNTMETGLTENSTASVPTTLQSQRSRKANGEKARESGGSLTSEQEGCRQRLGRRFNAAGLCIDSFHIYSYK